MSSRIFHLLALGALVLAAPLALAQSDEGPVRPDPVEIARNAAAAITAMAERCVEGNQTVAAKTVAAIEKLLAEGHPRQAFRVAAAGVNVVHRRSIATSTHVRERFIQAATVLRRLGAEPLAQRLKLLTEDKLEAIAASRREAVEAIRAALPAMAGETAPE